MVHLKVFECVLVLIWANTVYGVDDYEVSGEADMLPAPANQHHENSEKLTRSVDDVLNEIDDVIDSNSVARKRPALKKNDQCDYMEIQRMHKQCICHMPKKQCLRISELDSTAVLTMPECVVVERCEGICPHSKSCLPKVIEIISIPIMVMGSAPGNGYGSPQKSHECKSIQVEKHVKCECRCNKSQNDCSAKQIFNPNLCQCDCPNPMKREQCKTQNKIWNSSKCECVCPPVISQTCSTGAFFHKTHCKCLPVEPERAWKRKNKLHRFP